MYGLCRSSQLEVDIAPYLATYSKLDSYNML